MMQLPQMIRARQLFQRSAPVDLHQTLATELSKLLPRIRPGARIAVAVGSRGITNLSMIVSSVVELLKAAGAHPFLIPAMGSHGGATPEGQSQILADYGITEPAAGAPVISSLDVRQIGTSADGVPAFCSVDALESDGVVLINRIKPHTDFTGMLGSGLLKMAVIGLGKHRGAAEMHVAATRIGHERAIRNLASVILREAPVLGGVAILENQFHETARVAVLMADEMPEGEAPLLDQARDLMPRLPFDEIDLLIVDRIGKNISGAGLDPNVTGRWVDGYSSDLMRGGRKGPFIRRIFVRDLTPETHGNAIGIGLADITTSRLVRAMDHRATYINALTALTPQCAKVPIQFETDRECIERALASLALQSEAPRVVHIANTLELEHLSVSEALRPALEANGKLEALGSAEAMAFDAEQNLIPIAVS